MYIQETFINQNQNAIFGESDVYEASTDDTARLFRNLQREYGRCRSKIYIDVPLDTEGGEEYTTGDGQRHKSKAIGWVFEKRMKYEDAQHNRPEDYYIREVWVTLYEKADTVTREKHYLFLS